MADARYLLIVRMDIPPEREALFNEIYDREHIPNLLRVPGVLRATRARSEACTLMLGGEPKELPAASPRYTTIYELESPEVLASEAWISAMEAGRWPGEVRPFAINRRHQLARVLTDSSSPLPSLLTLGRWGS